MADRRKHHLEFYEKVSNAKSILIAGAGVVGVELVAEFAAKFGASNEKKIGICMRGDRILPGYPAKAGRIA